MYKCKPVDVSRLSPLKRGYLMGYRRARHKARAELRDMAAHFDAELESLQHDYHEIALEVHHDRYDRALDAAIEQRAMDADITLH